MENLHKRYKVPNLHGQKMRRMFERQKLDPNFRQWKKNRLKRQGGMCFYCHKQISFKGSNVDHIMPLWRGGNNRRANLVITCWPCNHSKGVNIVSRGETLELRQKVNSRVREDKQAVLRAKIEEERLTDFIRSLM